MKILLYGFLVFFVVSLNVQAVEIQKPLMVLADESGVPIEGIIDSESHVEAFVKAYAQCPDGTLCSFQLIRPTASITVDKTSIVPIPDPDPIPDPPPTASCNVVISTGDTINENLVALPDGQTLCLNDGIYEQWVDVPSNKHIAAVNTGMAVIDGSNLPDVNWSYGTLSLLGSNSSATGIKVHHAPTHWDACKVDGTNNILRRVSCSHGGSYVHKLPISISGTGHLVEDSWFFGDGRYTMRCFNGGENTIRRNVLRWDSTAPNNGNQPNAAMSNYSCSDTIWENNISLDYGVPVTAMVHCGDICMSTIDNDNENYRVKYLGNIVVNHSSGTNNNRAFRADQKGTVPSDDVLIRDMFISGASTGIVFNNLYTNVVVFNCTTFSLVDEMDDGSLGNNEPLTCTDDADITVRYINGVKTSQPLFPFPNESLIKRDMCGDDERQSDWCVSSDNLTDYIQSFVISQ